MQVRFYSKLGTRGRLIIAAWLGILLNGCWAPSLVVRHQEPIYTKEILSDPYLVDKIYPSMRGPSGFLEVQLGEADENELLWIVGYETEVVDAKTSVVLSQEFMCHANLDLSAPLQRMQSVGPLKVNGRVFTLSQGQQKISFPKGFGIPVLSRYPLELSTQVLNLNKPEFQHEVRHRVKIHYQKDSELRNPMTGLFLLGVEVLKVESENPDQSSHFGFSVNENPSGPGCGIGVNADPFDDMVVDMNGRPFIGHWYVQPGRERSRTEVTRRLALPYDMKVHYIAAHMHPTAESLELVDTTEMSQVFRAQVRNSETELRIEDVNHYSSTEGLWLRRDHEYSLVSVYDNQTGKPVDSMAVLYLYCADPQFDKERFRQSDREFCPPYPGAKETYTSQSEHVLDIGWESPDEFLKVKEFYAGRIDWDGPHQTDSSSCYWVLGRPKTLSLDGPVEPSDPESETGLLWVWTGEEGQTKVLYSHWKPATVETRME